MRTTILFAIWAVNVALTVAGVRADIITPDQAKDAVRAFEENPNLQFSSVMLDQDTEPPVWAHRPQYCLDLDSPTLDRGWSVDATTGEVTFAHYGDAFPSDEDASETPFGPMTEQQCWEIADSFVRAHYSGFGALNMHTDNAGEWTDKGWRFNWWEELACGASTPNGVDVEVNPADGRIECYTANRIATPNPPAPQLTAEQAITAAQSAASIVTLEWHDEPSLRADPDGIDWMVQVGGEKANGDGVLAAVKINAVSGVVLGIYPGSGSPADRRQSPNARERQATTPANDGLVWLRDLVRGSRGSSVRWLGRAGAELRLGHHAYTLKPGSRTAKVGNASISLTRSPALKNGRLMVPADLLESLKRGSQ